MKIISGAKLENLSYERVSVSLRRAEIGGRRISGYIVMMRGDIKYQLLFLIFCRVF